MYILSQQKTDNPKERVYIIQTLQSLLQQLSLITGLDFKFIPSLEIKPEYLSHNTNLDHLSQNLQADENDANKLIMNANALGNINIGKSEKAASFDSSIHNQVNFATDLPSVDLIEKSTGTGPTHPISHIFDHIKGDLKTKLPMPKKGSAGMAGFYEFMIQKLAGLFAIFPQEYVRESQKRYHKYLASKVNNQNPDKNDAMVDENFRMFAKISSRVKDVTPLWVKDHVASVAHGMLNPGHDYPLLVAALQVDLSSWEIPEYINGFLDHMEGKYSYLKHNKRADHWAHFTGLLNDAIQKLITDFSDGTKYDPDQDAGPKVGMYEHDPEFAGARQDTYLNPQNVQQSGLWDQRLHVAEVRNDDAPEQISKALEKMRK